MNYDNGTYEGSLFFQDKGLKMMLERCIVELLQRREAYVWTKKTYLYI